MRSPEEIIVFDKFGIPDIAGVDQSNLYLQTTDHPSIPGSSEKNYSCKKDNYKFCLVHKTMGAIFTMDFYIPGSRIRSLRNEDPSIKLELLYVHKDCLRNRGIASYYMEKLVEFANERRIANIRVHVNPDAKNFKEDSGINTLTRAQLESFYKKYENEALKVTFI
jgi:ribosomal protein S18 acetylase RimI-like enzyme